jgi:hypothetical protein
MTEMILGVAGGLGLFLYGMIQMSEGLKKVAGTKLKNILESMTKNRIIGCLVGAGITALIQSSSAATHSSNPVKLCCNRYGGRFCERGASYTQAGHIRDYRHEYRDDSHRMAGFNIRF